MANHQSPPPPPGLYWVRRASLLAWPVLTVGFSVSLLAASNTLVLRSTPNEPAKVKILESYGRVPLHFEANNGQTDRRVKFLTRGSGYTLFLTSTEAVLALDRPVVNNNRAESVAALKATKTHADESSRAVVRMKLVGANPAPQVEGQDELSGKGNYFMGKDPKHWRTEVPTYAKVKYEDAYPGIDLVYYGNQSQLEYDFVIAPGVDPKAITLGFEGAYKLELDAHGDLVLHTDGGQIRQHKPLIYQNVDGVRKAISGGYVFKDENRVGFQVAQYDMSKPLIIDPTLAYSTYLGGSNSDAGRGIAVDSSGSAYVTGSTSSTDFPTTAGAFDTNGGDDTFVTKLNPTGTALVYSTYLGGGGFDVGRSIAVDAAGNAYATGMTTSTDFPTTPGAFQPANASGGCCDAFVVKLNATGNALAYSTYLGGSNSENVGSGLEGRGIAVDGFGNAYVTGTTNSTDFPITSGAFQTSKGIAGDAFVTKLSALGSALIYSTYLGGNNDDRIEGIAVDSAGNAYVTGATGSTDFPTVSPFHAEGPGAFVTKLNATGTGLVYSTYLGGSFGATGYAIAVDGSGSAYVTGETDSPDFPSVNPFQPNQGGAFVQKLNPAGTALVYSSRLGGTDGGSEDGFGIAVDSAGNAYVTGRTNSSDFPLVSPIQPAAPGSAFVAKINAAGNAFIYSTHLGGSSDDEALGIAVDGSGSAYVTGFTGSVDFPTANAFQPNLNVPPPPCDPDEQACQPSDAFVTKVADDTAPATVNLIVTKADLPDPVLAGDRLTYTIDVSNSGPGDATGVILTDTLPASVVFVSSAPGSPTCNASASTVTCDLGTLTNGASATVTLTLTVRPTATGTISNTAEVAGNETDPDEANNTDTEATAVNPVTCGGLPATIVGTPGNDTLSGTNGADVIHGLSGNDVISAGNAKDVVCGGNGNDTISGGNDIDRLFGDSGNDTLNGDKGNDALDGGADTDSCNGGQGSDTAAGCEAVSSVP